MEHSTETITDSLNQEQLTAVTAPVGNMMVIAGAGSGKTRVLTARFAYLVHAHQVSPYSIAALTFTNRAATEMRERIEILLNGSFPGLWIGTFHGIALRLLRRHTQEAGLPTDFQILNTDDQQRLIKRILKTLNLDPSDWSPRSVAAFINAEKEAMHRFSDTAAIAGSSPPPIVQIRLQMYQAYEEDCNRGGLVDFTEMLLRVYELLRDHSDLLERYRLQFQELLVDEFQDTNPLQYSWLKLLAGTSGRVTVVGDDDQSIYSWRGARVENMRDFLNDFQTVQLIKLEQNYRSTSSILTAANALIAANPKHKRMDKVLWTDKAGGRPIRCYQAGNEQAEARFVLEQILSQQAEGKRLSEMAVLYRSHAQSRAFEEACLARNLSYVVYGGLPFYERAEVRHALAYMRLFVNPDADEAFERVVNFPTRGIGSKMLGEVRSCARANGVSLWRACVDMRSQLTGRGTKALAAFCASLNLWQEQAKSLKLHEIAELALEATGLRAHFQRMAERDELAQSRLENLDELVSACQDYEPLAQRPDEDGQDDAGQLLRSFLDNVVLDAGGHQADQDALRLMTLHSAKGLEFSLVFMVGMEEGLFPHYLSAEQPEKLEEERRLCYVGMTRAMAELCLTYAVKRQLHGVTKANSRSRFINELPQAQIEYVGQRHVWVDDTDDEADSLPDTSQALDTSQMPDTSQMRSGARVVHAKFGLGNILSTSGTGEKMQVQVRFEHAGIKQLMVMQARLTMLN